MRNKAKKNASKLLGDAELLAAVGPDYPRLLGGEIDLVEFISEQGFSIERLGDHFVLTGSLEELTVDFSPDGKEINLTVQLPEYRAEARADTRTYCRPVPVAG